VATLDDLSAGKYVSVTTFRTDGTPVATPVWLVRRRDELLVLTHENSGKVKRIRNNPNVLVAPCDARGRLQGPEVPGVARLQDEVETHLTANLIQHRYGIMGRAFGWLTELRSGGQGGQHIGVTITLSYSE
jgi:PPOX class probable F420-dependent enzyme